nr:nitrate transporter 2 [Durusdinium sp.]
MSDFKLAVDENNKATELPLLRVCGTVQQNPHMRAFWGATFSFFLAFLGWFALAPLGLEVATSMGRCENQLYPPDTNPQRVAYLKYKNISTTETYCQYGTVKADDGTPTDCQEVPTDIANNATAPAEEKLKYRPNVLSKCVCTTGTQCNGIIANAGVAAVASTIFVRIALGTLLERFGPVNVQSGLLTFGAIWVALAATIQVPWQYTIIRFFIGCAGATFVTNQFWCSLMFSPNVVGTANATAAGWGNLGGGVTQIFMISVLFNPMVNSGMAADTAWRVSMIIPAVLFLICAAAMKLLCWDTPTAKRFDVAVTGKVNKPSMWDYVEVLKDVRVVVMIFQYSACFGTELAMNNQLATHFRTYFQLPAADASALAGAFGLMNLFARSLGGISSDILFKYVGFRGRIWAQFLALFFEAIFLFCFGLVDNSQPWYVALAVLVCFSLFVQMAEGTSYGIVPFMNKQQLAVVSALVGAGGNLGAVIAGFCFYRPINDPLIPFQVHAGYVMFWALLTPCYYWREHGGMFSGPAVTAEAKVEDKSQAETAETSV